MGVFNHAIVYVEANPPIWIDPTMADARTGSLPPQDQGRLALIANEKTTELVRIPEAQSKDASLRYAVEVRLSDFGPGTVTASLDASGTLSEAVLRAVYADGEKSGREAAEKWVKQSFGAKSLGRFEAMPRDDMSGPYKITAEGLHCSTTSTNLDDATAELGYGELLTSFPAGLFAPDGDDPESKKPRERDFILPQAFRIEYRYHVTPPPLYRIGGSLTPSETKLGGAVLSRQFSKNADGTVDATYRVDSGKRRWTAAEVEAFRAAIKQSLPSTSDTLTFASETGEYVALGQTSKAIGLLRERLGTSGGSAILHARLSRLVLLSAGLGGAAVAEAKIATELDPKLSVAWQALGWAYEHDTFGRRMEGNWNSAEDLRCARKAVEMDPDSSSAKMDLASLLERDERGTRYGKGARVQEAVDLYREVLKNWQNSLAQQNLATALLLLRQWKSAKEEAGKCEGDLKTVLLAAISAVEEGPERATANLSSAYPDPRQRFRMFLRTVSALNQIGEPEKAQVITEAAARIPGVSEEDTRYRDRTAALAPENDPRSPVQRLITEAFRGNTAAAIAASLFSKRSGVDPSRLRRIQGGLLALRRQVDSDESALSFALSSIITEKICDEPEIYRTSPVSTMPVKIPTMYVMAEDGTYRIAGFAPESMAAIGEVVLGLVSKNKIEPARHLLDQTVSGAGGDWGSRPDGTGVPSIRALWSGMTPELRGANSIRLAAAGMIGLGGGARALPILTEARLKATKAFDRAQIDKAICEALARTNKWSELAAAGKTLEASAMFSEEGFRYATQGLAGAKKWAELDLEARKRYQLNPSNRFALRTVALAKALQGDGPATAEWSRKLAASPLADSEDRMVSAWIALRFGPVNAQTLASLQKYGGQGETALYHYTVALLFAALKQPEKAQQALMLGVDSEEYSQLDAVAWAAYARICEAYGFAGESAAALDRARAARTDHVELMSLLRL